MLNIAIVDDLAEDRERLFRDVSDYFGGEPSGAVVRVFLDAASFLQAHAKIPFQLVFLDIVMDSMDGLALSQMLRGIDTSMLIVFVSSSREYAFDAFPVHPFDYLVKPYERERLRGVLVEAERALSAAEPTINIRVPYDSLDVPVSRISSVVAQGHAVEVTLTDGRLLRSVMTFTELSGRLTEDERFLLLNRGVLVNMDDVLTVQEDTMRMKTGAIHSLRVRNRSALISRFTQYQIARMRKGSHL